MTDVRDRSQALALGALRPTSPPGSTRSLLLTVLGELVLPMEGPVWTASLLYVLGGLGVGEPAARQAIARAADSGWLRGEKVGREVRWWVGAAGAELIEEITRRVLSLNSAPERWDGRCLIVAVTVSEDRRAVRKRLYSALEWAGFGNPSPGLWTSPHVDRFDETKQVIHALGLQDSTMAFVGTTASIGITDAEIVRRAWDLDEVGQRYERLITSFAGSKPESGDDLLFALLSLVDQWTQFPYMDPQLPHDLLPDWIGRRATRIFIDLYKQWGPLAQDRWREVVQMTSPPAISASA